MKSERVELRAGKPLGRNLGIQMREAGGDWIPFITINIGIPLCEDYYCFSKVIIHQIF